MLQVPTKKAELQKDRKEAGDQLAGNGSRSTISQYGPSKQADKVVGVLRESQITPTQYALVFVVLKASIKYVLVYIFLFMMFIWQYISAG